MDIVSIILCGLALLTAVVNTALFFREKKRTNTRFSAMGNLLDKTNERVGRHSDFIRDIDDRLFSLSRIVDDCNESISEIYDSQNDFEENLQALNGDMDLVSKANVEIEKKLSKQIKGLRGDIDVLRRDIKGLKSANAKYSSIFAENRGAHEQLSEQIEALKQAISDLELDYKEAQEAANSVNDYASSLMNIFNFDPMEAEKKARKGGKAE